MCVHGGWAAVTTAACPRHHAWGHHQLQPAATLNSSLPQVKVVRAAAAEVFAAAGASVEYQVGTMIEVPRGALRAGDLANHAEFFSFGTNDLTQVRGAGWLAGLMRLGVGG